MVHHLFQKTAFITGGNGNLRRLVADQLRALGIRVIKFHLPGAILCVVHDDSFVM